MEPTVSISGLFKNYGKVKALQGLDLTIEAGQIYGLLGPNGSGKSTLIKTLVGAVKPTAGKVLVLGKAMPRESRSVRSRLGYMPQNPALYGDISVRANVKFFAQAHKLDRLEERGDQVLAFVGLIDQAGRKAEILSGGLKQRCSLACALVHEPELLLLDEPTAGVDPVLKEGFWKYFQALKDQGKTIIITTHLMDEPLLCDRLGILREGQMIVDNTPGSILSRGKTEVTLEIAGTQITKEVSDYSRELPGILSQYGLKPGLSKISIRQENLEDIFLRLLKEKVKG
ncbi:MAG: ABC transporter ATP-binding protein [Deltaproteobacteria bacterium]|nr:ABC transporter ATP-binding protein [Deltaproteobacteria bacterium]